ncbi:NAD(P)-dependent alcohol dehydrogenase [soil metagenome]
MISMNAAVVGAAGGPPEITTVTLDEPRSDEVLVKLVASGLRHTDMAFRDRVVTPSAFGHEGSGIVEEVGSAVHGFSAGDKVVLAQGHEERGDSLGQSTFGGYVLALERNLVKVADDTPLELLEILGPLGGGIQAGAGAVLNSLGVEAGASIVIFGAGGAGLGALLAAVIAGATTIIVSDTHESRLELARSLGATDTILASDPDGPAKMIDLTHGGADFSVETSGNMGAARTSVDILNSTGTAAMVGIGRPGAMVAFDHALLRSGRRVIGVTEEDTVPQEFIPAMIELHRQGRFAFDAFVRRYPFTDIQKAVDDSESGVTVKGVLVYDR